MTTPPTPDHPDDRPSSRPAEVAAQLDTVTADLHREFGARLPAETIREAVDGAYDELAANATINQHLPVLATRQARRRLTALASPTQPTGGGTR